MHRRSIIDNPPHLRRERSIILPKVIGGGRRWCASQGRLGVEIDALAGGPRSVRHREPKRPYRSSSSGSGTWGSDASVQGPSKKSEGVAGGGARRRGGLASRLTRLLAAHIVLAACGTGDQNAPIAQVRAGPGPGGVTRAFKDPPKSRRGWQEVVRVAGAAWRRD
jgi:hypothetical protein